MSKEIKNLECPCCGEQIKSNASKCNNCNSCIYPITHLHGGTCPYCKETIHLEALKCKHCHSFLIDTERCTSREDTLQYERPWYCVYLPDGRQFCVLKGTGDVVILDLTAKNSS